MCNYMCVYVCVCVCVCVQGGGVMGAHMHMHVQAERSHLGCLGVQACMCLLFLAHVPGGS